MPEDLESNIAQALTDHGGPPELAPQLIALAEKHVLLDKLLYWIAFHLKGEWSAQQFNEWAKKYKATEQAIAKGER